MSITITDRKSLLSEDLHEFSRRRLLFALSRFGAKIGRVSVVITDVNGHRKGVDKQCRITVSMPGSDTAGGGRSGRGRGRLCGPCRGSHGACGRASHRADPAHWTVPTSFRQLDLEKHLIRHGHSVRAGGVSYPGLKREHSYGSCI